MDIFDSVDIVGDGTNIPLVDGAVVTVTCDAVIERVPNPADLLSEIHRVLKPGGYVQLMVPFVFPFRLILNGVSGGWLTFPLKHLDLCLNRKPKAANLGAAFDYMGRKPQTAGKRD